MDEPLIYGWRTAVLSVAFVELLLIAGHLTRPLRNLTANRTLAALLIVLAGLITPWMIGFAGFYDRWRWLTFAPFAISLAVAPLSFFYVHALVTDRWPENWKRSLALPALQFAYLSSMFLVLRQPGKNDWLVASSPFYDAVTGAGVIIGLLVYAGVSRRLIAQYRSLLSQQRSDDDRLGLAWLENVILALFVLLAIWAVYSIWDVIAQLDYRGLTGLYVAIAAFALFLGIGGLRHASTEYPTIKELTPTPTPSADWKQRGSAWLQRVETERLYADPELSVPTLARLLGTNSAYVSRAFNEGVGESFSTLINRLRSEEVASALRSGEKKDLLTLALSSGFSSKASFNRAFKERFGCSPSIYRQSHVSDSVNSSSEAI